MTDKNKGWNKKTKKQIDVHYWPSNAAPILCGKEVGAAEEYTRNATDVDCAVCLKILQHGTDIVKKRAKRKPKGDPRQPELFKSLERNGVVK